MRMEIPAVLEIPYSQKMRLHCEKYKFDMKDFLATIGEGRTLLPVPKRQTIYAQGAACAAVFYIQTGKVRLTVVAKNGKEATICILNPGDFFGEGSLAGHPYG
jgi:CRP/FNR family cyclic AMP-dependent transcriptional regulator